MNKIQWEYILPAIFADTEEPDQVIANAKAFVVDCSLMWGEA